MVQAGEDHLHVDELVLELEEVADETYLLFLLALPRKTSKSRVVEVVLISPRLNIPPGNRRCWRGWSAPRAREDDIGQRVQRRGGENGGTVDMKLYIGGVLFEEERRLRQ